MADELCEQTSKLTIDPENHSDEGDLPETSENLECPEEEEEEESEYLNEGESKQRGSTEDEEEQKKLDEDEDRKNPQYIPKKGTFYEHDNRNTEGKAADVPVTEIREKKNKKIFNDKWRHDRYNDHDQAPKSNAELIAVYGYDIRNEEAPPKSRRRRRYNVHR